MVHWHGFHIPPDVDGAHEEGTPMVQGHDQRKFTFTPEARGHALVSHACHGRPQSEERRLHRPVRHGDCRASASDPARYDLEVPDPAARMGALLLRRHA